MKLAGQAPAGDARRRDPAIDGGHDWGVKLGSDTVYHDAAHPSHLLLPVLTRSGRLYPGTVPARRLSSSRMAIDDALHLNAALRAIARERDDALAAAREAEERQRFLADASKLLDSTLDYQPALDRLAQFVVPALADWCVVDVYPRDGLPAAVAVAHADRRKIGALRALRQRWPAAGGSQEAPGAGDAVLHPEITDALLVSAARDQEHLEALRALGPWTSSMVLPLKGRGGTLGALTLVSGESGRVYDQQHLALAAELASRAGLAFDNARLYAREQKARVEAERLQALTRQLSSALAVDDVLQEIATTAGDLLEAPVAGVFLRDASGERFELAAGKGLTVTDKASVFLPSDRSLAGRVVVSGQTVVVHDVARAPVTALPSLVSGRAVGSLVVAPITARSGPLGAIEVYSAEIGAFTERHGELLSTLAGAAAAVLQNAQLYEAERRARNEAQRLQALTERLGRSITPDAVLNQIAETAADLLSSPIAGVFLLDPDAKSFDLVAGRGLELGTGLGLPRDRSLAGQVITSGNAVTVTDVRAAPITALPQLVSGEAIGSLVVAPIIASAGPLGVVEVYSSMPGTFTAHDAELLAGLAGAAAAVLENARLYHERELDLAHLRTIVEQLPVGIAVVERNGRVSLTNRQAERLFGVALEQMTAGTHDGRKGFQPSGQPYEPGEWPLARALRDGELVNSELVEVQRPDGGRSFLSVNAAPIRDDRGAIAAAVAIFDDVSGEEELRRQKEQFLTAAAHDLKTPLTSIRGLAQLLERQLRRVERVPEARLQSTLTGIQTATQKMAALIDELLDVSRLESTGSLSLSRTETDLVALASSVLETHRGGAPRHRLELEASVERLAGCWDRQRLERAVSNLVGNAIKYSPSGGAVRVEITTRHEGSAEYAVLSVSDQGIGIPEGDLQRIFQRFERASNVPRTVAGSGVGLTYVQHVVTEHGGSMTVSSQPGGGTTFTIRLPMAEQS